MPSSLSLRITYGSWPSLRQAVDVAFSAEPAQKFAGSIGRQPMARVFLADCQPLFNEALEALIARDGNNEVVGQASTAAQVSESVVHLKPDLVVIDSDLGLASRPTLVETILQDLADTKVILLSQETDIDLLLLAIRSGALGVVGKKSGTQTVLRAVQAVLDGEGVVPRAMLPELFRRLIDLGDRASDTPLSRLSPREREVLALLGRGWRNSRIGDELFISPHTVRTHVQNILQKLEMHSKLEAATFAMQHELASKLPLASESEVAAEQTPPKKPPAKKQKQRSAKQRPPKQSASPQNASQQS